MKLGVIREYKGPFSSGHTINLEGNCKIGISIGEDDFQSFGAAQTEQGWIKENDFSVEINGERVVIGRTFMYEITDIALDNPTISFPDGAPVSTIVDVVYANPDF